MDVRTDRDDPPETGGLGPDESARTDSSASTSTDSSSDAGAPRPSASKPRRATRVEEASFLVVESGRIRFFVRPKVGGGGVTPKVELAVVRALEDIQRFSFTLAPRNSGQVRRLSVGRKRLPDDRVRERHWAYVDRVGPHAQIVSDLGPRQYTTKTSGLRSQAGVIEVASGTYAIALHRDHAHLMYELGEDGPTASSELLRQLRIAPRASYIAVIFNPASRWRVRDREEVPFSEPVDDAFEDRFDKRRFAPLDPIFLDHEGTELVLIGGGQSEDLGDATDTRS